MAEEKKIINFMGARKIAMMFSALLLLGAVYSLFDKQLAFGLDFTGGTQIEVLYERSVELGTVRKTLEEAGFDGAFRALPFHVAFLVFQAEIMTVVRLDIGAQCVAVIQDNTGSGGREMGWQGMFHGFGIRSVRIAEEGVRSRWPAIVSRYNLTPKLRSNITVSMRGRPMTLVWEPTIPSTKIAPLPCKA